VIFPALFQLFFPGMYSTPVLLNAKQGFFYSLKALAKASAFSVIFALRRVISAAPVIFASQVILGYAQFGRRI
ncbi:MAG: hypothetical protein IIV61_08205, partial [Oscillospiraceae bacterium]|nr:hypothetical protein [Oscillospiraceae bacterium]